MNTDFKIAMAGPSGTGKTTLANIIQTFTGVPFISTSAYDTLTEESLAYLKDRYGYENKGHRNVIKMSSVNEDFGWDFQVMLQRDRDLLYDKNPRFVVDRSPLDNAAYTAMQCLSYISESQYESYIGNCLNSFRKLTHLIITAPAMNVGEVEDNGKRVANRYFQKTTFAVFMQTYKDFFEDFRGKPGYPKVLILDTWDLELKEELVKDFLLD